MKLIHPGQDVVVVFPDLGGVSTSGRVREIKDPQAIKPGNNMPSLRLSDHDLDAIVAYLESLR